MTKEVAVLGVGMHPWGKWGQSFVTYGVKAAQDALKDAGRSTCPDCGAPRQPHRVCPNCGKYRGRVIVETDEE